MTKTIIVSGKKDNDPINIHCNNIIVMAVV